jgi:putative transposase
LTRQYCRVSELDEILMMRPRPRMRSDTPTVLSSCRVWSLTPARRLDVKNPYMEEQIIGFLRETDRGVVVKELCRKYEFSEASYYLWRSRFGGMDLSDAKRLKSLEAESSRLKKLLVETMLESEVAKEALRSNRGRAGEACAGAYDGDAGLAERRCLGLAGVSALR